MQTDTEFSIEYIYKVSKMIQSGQITINETAAKDSYKIIVPQELVDMVNARDKETTQCAAQRAIDWYDSPALYYGPNQEETARETLYKSVLGEDW